MRIGVLALALLAGCSASEGEPPGPEGATSAGASAAVREARPSSLFRSPSRGAARPEGMGSRGDVPGTPRVTILDPKDHVGETRLARPTLYAIVATTTDATVRLDIEGRSAERSVLAGETLVAFPLDEAGIELQPDLIYAWTISVPFTGEGISSAVRREGFVRRLAPAGAGGAEASVEALLGEGVWYDALARVLTDTLRWRDAWSGMRQIATANEGA